jgi:hypothetical protein
MMIEKGNFYVEPGGEIYYYDESYLHCPGNENNLTPTVNPHPGLSSFHDLEVDVRKFQKVDPSEYLKREKKRLEELIQFIKEYS